MTIKSVVSSALTVLACGLGVTLVMRPTVVSGASMMPTLHDRDVLITSPLATQLFRPTRGDIVTICLSATRCRAWRPGALRRMQYFRDHPGR
jgi:signal peptidase I